MLTKLLHSIDGVNYSLDFFKIESTHIIYSAVTSELNFDNILCVRKTKLDSVNSYSVSLFYFFIPVSSDQNLRQRSLLSPSLKARY